MRALVLNAGSSSLKYQVIDTATRETELKGQVERIGTAGVTHKSALEDIIKEIAAAMSLQSIDVIGHRVVHGGHTFSTAVKITDEVVNEIEKIVPLAPLHNPANLTVIKELRMLLPDVQHVAVFDTAFHSTMPAEAFTYALDREVAEKYQVRKYGFHGSSHKYVTAESGKFLGKSSPSLIICHIGNGASVTAVSDGVSIDTSMGMTPLEGLVMGTRTGDIDAGIVFHLAREANFSISDLDNLLNKKSGLLGLTGHSDMREIAELAHQGDKAALLAREIYAYRIRKYIGSYMTLLPNLDAVVFTAGVGENDPELRELVISPLAHLDLALDAGLNASLDKNPRLISSSRTKVLVVPTNEELEIALESERVIGG
jgi:acetate kinase